MQRFYVARNDSIFLTIIEHNEKTKYPQGFRPNLVRTKERNNQNTESVSMFNQKEYNKCANFEIVLGVISMIIMIMIILM